MELFVVFRWRPKLEKTQTCVMAQKVAATAYFWRIVTHAGSIVTCVGGIVTYFVSIVTFSDSCILWGHSGSSGACLVLGVYLYMRFWIPSSRARGRTCMEEVLPP